MMTVKEMSNERLMREYVVAKRQAKTLQSTIKQIEEELNERFDKNKLAEKEGNNDE